MTTTTTSTTQSTTESTTQSTTQSTTESTTQSTSTTESTSTSTTTTTMSSADAAESSANAAESSSDAAESSSIATKVWSCDFESDFCGAAQRSTDYSDNIQWMRLNQGTASYMTGPSDAASGDYYTYIEATGKSYRDYGS